MDRLAAMEAFVRVVDTGSFSETARQLHVGQPAVSKTIAQLEERLGVKLLLRSTRGLTPTEAGENFYQGRSAPSKRRTRRIVPRAAPAPASPDGCASARRPPLPRLHVVPYLPPFLAAHPHLDLELILDDRQIDLIEEGIDIGLRMGELRDSSPDRAAHRAGAAHRARHPDYFAKAGEPRVPAELMAHQAVIHARGPGGDVWMFHKNGAEVSISVKSRIRVSAAEGSAPRCSPASASPSPRNGCSCPSSARAP